MRRRSGSVIYITELLMSLMIFALCASVCASIFVVSRQYSARSGELSQAVVVTQSCAEAFKKYPDKEELAKVLRGDVQGEDCVIYYDKDWTCTNTLNAVYIARITPRKASGLRAARVTASRLDGGQVYSLDVSALRVEGQYE